MNGSGALLVFLLIVSPAIIFITYGKQEGRKLAIENPNPDFISIDCGAPGDYPEQNGVLYKSDADFIDSGIDGQISTEFIYENIEQQARNLRSFPNGSRNCYTLNPRSGKNNTYLIRASFYYGNYDGKNQVPVFDLYIGVNRWATINLTDYSYEEIVYVPSTNYIHVCLVDIGSGTPYISTLELRLLNNSMYRIESGALALVERDDVGVSFGPSRYYYPDDVYDRGSWGYLNPKVFDTWLPISTTSSIDSLSNDAYKIPDQVLITAARSQNTSVPLTFRWNRSYSTARQYYVYFHFAEIEQLPDGQQREIEISLPESDNNFRTIINLEYLTPVTVVSSPINGSLIKFHISSTKGSPLPPILNAFEVFELIELPNSSTIPTDVDAMMKIKQEYKVINRNWQGDPCAPIEYSWDGLNCSNANLPTIISLNLSSSQLTGTIAESFFELKAIESLDLSNNSLTGTIPEFLGKLPNLKILNLARNNFTGSVPQTLLKMQKEGSLWLRLDENLYLYQTNSYKKKSNKKFVVPVVASAVSVLLLLILLGAIPIYRRNKRRQQGGIVSKSKDMKSKNQRFSYSALERITNNFQTVIGEGGFGKVFLGTLHDGTQVAVKLLSALSKQGFKEFRAEAQLLMIVNHRNLVSLIGYCDEGRHMGLIYEYMDNGNLQQHLSESKANILSWNDRLQIAVDAAQGLEYLHNGCKPTVIHRDLKTSNILLDKNMRAKIADFGLSRVFINENDTHVSTRPSGTPGYLDPEFHSSGNLNKKSDVYSFGVILFELVTGRRALIRGPANQTCHILQWVIPTIERGNIENIVDPKLNGEFNHNTAWKAVEIALSCIPSTAIQRPDMSSVLSELKECLAMEMTTEITKTESYDTEPINSLETELDLYPLAR